MENEIKLLKKRITELEAENANLKLKQVEVNKAKELYLKIFEDFPALIWRSRLDMLCDYFNKTWLEFTGRSMEQEFGNGWAEGVHPDDFDFCLETYVRNFEKREAFLMEYRMKNKFGEYRWIRDFGRPFYDLDHTFLGYIGSCYDITEIKTNEIKLIHLNRTKDKFFSIIAHDLRNPFNQILGFSEFLKENYLSLDESRLKMVAEQIFSASKNTYHLLENLLEWAKSQSNSDEFLPRKINFANVCHDVIEGLSSNADTKGIFVRCFTPEKIVIDADLNMFKTVLRNLISNAIKYTNKNGEINVCAERIHQEFVITVSDNGIGIDPKNINQLFENITNGSKLGTAGEQGTGLGLMLCKDFVERHGGRIWVESKLGQGSSFKFTIPYLLP